MFPYLYCRINTDVALQQTCNLQKAYMIKLGMIGTHHQTYSKHYGFGGTNKNNTLLSFLLRPYD